MENTDFNVLLYENEGEGCKDQDGFLSLRLSGKLRSSIKFGVTMVGTISPDLKLEEAYSYFDSNPKFAGSLAFNGKGTLDIDGGNPRRQLLSSPVTNYEFSHPGIVSFRPEMNMEARMIGSGQIDG